MHSVLVISLVCITGWIAGWSGGHFDSLSGGWILVVLALTTVHFVMEPLRWQLYAGKGDSARLATFYHVFSSTAFLSYVLPAKLGLPLRYWLITRHQGMRAGTVGAVMAIDSALSVLLWTLASVALGGGMVVWLFEKYAVAPHAGAALLLAGGSALALAMLVAAGAERRRRLIDAAKRAMSEISAGRLASAGIVFLADIAVYVLRHAAILAAISAAFPGWQAVGTATVLGIYAGFLCMLPMGLIGYDAVVVLLLTQYGVPLEMAVMVPVINRSANIVVGIALGVPSSLKLGLGMSRQTIAAMLGENRNEK